MSYPNQALLHFRQSIAFVDEGRFRDALDHLDIALDIFPLFAEAYSLRGEIWLRLNQKGLALESLNMAIKFDSRTASRDHANRGLIHLDEGNYDEAIDDFTMFLEEESDGYLFLMRGRALVRVGDLDAGLADFCRAVELGYDEALPERAELYFHRGKKELALEDLEAAVAKHPENSSLYCLRGGVFIKLGEYERARADLRKALELSPQDPMTMYNFACLYSLRKKTGLACEWLGKAVRNGFSNISYIKNDPDLENIRNEICYHEIISGTSSDISH